MKFSTLSKANHDTFKWGCVLGVALSFSPTSIIKVKDLGKRKTLLKIMHNKRQNLARNPEFLDIILPVGFHHQKR